MGVILMRVCRGICEVISAPASGSERETSRATHLDIRQLFLRQSKEVSVQATQNRLSSGDISKLWNVVKNVAAHLMSDNEDVLLPFQLHDDRLQPDHDIAVRLSTSISVVELVIISRLEIFRIFVLSLIS